MKLVGVHSSEQKLQAQAEEAKKRLKKQNDKVWQLVVCTTKQYIWWYSDIECICNIVQ